MKTKNMLFWLVMLCFMQNIAFAQRSELKLLLPPIDIGCIDDLKNIPAPSAEEVSYESSCERMQVKVKHIDDLFFNQSCSGGLLRIYSAEDACGSSVRDTQRILFVYDTLPPTVPDPLVSIDLGCNPDIRKAIPDPKDFDEEGCRDFRWLGDDGRDDGCLKSLTRKYEIFHCRGSFVFTQIYKWIEDNEPPRIKCPEDVHYGCNFLGIPPADPSQLVVEENCCLDSVYWSGDIIISDPDTCEHTLIRRYWAVDCCGNASYCDQVFNWYSFPNDPVIISCPPGQYLGCNIDPATDIPPATPELVEVEASCGEIEVKVASDLSVFGCEYSFAWIYTVEDECGNSSLCFQTYTWTVDTEAPTVISCPSDIDLGCNPDEIELTLVSPDFGIVAEDNCGIASIKKVKSSDVEKDACERFYFIYYEIIDHCGNATTCKQKVFWKEDTVPPHIQCPDDLDLGCNPTFIPTPNPSSVIADDNCCLEDVIWLLDVIVSDPSSCEQQRIRKYQAIDCCGNTSICEQKITWISDVTPPTITSCPAGSDLGCNINFPDDIPEATPDLVFAEDECSEVAVSHSLSTITVFGCEHSVTRTYVVRDKCGNLSQCFQTFTWTVDTVPPIVRKCPSDVDLGCNPDQKDYDLQSPDYGIDAIDNCGIKSIKRVETTDIIAGERCLKYYFIIYEISDFCGNVSSCKQRVSWTEDHVPPTIVCPPDLDLGCDPELIPEPDPTIVQADDNCCLDEVAMTASSISNNDGLFIITRTYTAFDCCGNKTSCDQMITWREEPNISNFITCPSDVDFGCVRVDPDIPDPIENTPYWGEECPSLFTHAGDNLVQVTPCEYELTRTYLFITCCGDTTPCYQTFEWQWVNTDTVIPVPVDQIVFCAVPPLPDFVGNLCGPGVPIFAGQNIIGDCSDGNCIIQRWWNSKGCLGSLYISDLQTIEVVCDFAPIDNLVDQSENENPELVIYPNPANEWLNLDLAVPILVSQIQVVNIQGQVVKRIVINETVGKGYQISISDLGAGMYHLQVDGIQSLSQRFVKL